ncbi:MAG: porin [Terracidiphilus sp.]
MYLNPNRILQSMAGAAMAMAMIAGAQTPAPPAPAPAPAAAPAPAPAPADQTPAAAPAAPTWSVGPMDISGFIDGYYSYNANRPSDSANGQVNDLYNFNDKTDQFNLSAAKLTLNHDPDPVGAHVDFLYGRTNTLVNNNYSAPSDPKTKAQLNYIEQAFLSLKPPKAKGLELDFGKFVTSAGAEVIESKDNWNYSRSLLFAYAIPYFHLGLRSSVPLSKTETVGLQVVNGWNNVTKTNGGATIGLTSAYVKPKYTWNLNYYTGPENPNTQKGYRNLIDTTLLLTPNAKFNAYINYDYGQNRDALVAANAALAHDDNLLNRWQGVALAARQQVTANSALAGRFEYFDDYQGFATGSKQDVKEFTGTYEYKWPEGLLARLEYRRDWSTVPFFHKGDTNMVDAQSTVTAGFVAFFGPKR